MSAGNALTLGWTGLFTHGTRASVVVRPLDLKEMSKIRYLVNFYLLHLVLSMSAPDQRDVVPFHAC